MVDAWKDTPACGALQSRLDAPPPSPLSFASREGHERSWVAKLGQLRALIARAARNSVRDPAAYALRYT